MNETRRLAELNRKRVAKFRRKKALMAKVNTLTIAPLIAWVENPVRKKGDSIAVTACIVQTPERFFYRLIALGNEEEIKTRLAREHFQAIVHMLPLRFKLVCLGE